MNETKQTIIDRASAMPAITWHFLKMNETAIEVPEGLAVAPDVRTTGSWHARDAADAFDNALAAAQARWEETHPAPTAEELAEREKYRAAEADATYGGTAQSTYQARADALEEIRSLAATFEQGTGGETAAYLSDAAGERLIVLAEPGEAVEAQVSVVAVQDAVSVAAIDVVAAKGGTVNLSITVDGSTQEAEDAQGFAGTTLRVFADVDAQVNIIRTQTLDNDFVDIDDMGLFADERARISVRQTVLGAGAAFTGLAGDLRGDSARVDVDTRYLGHGDQQRDFNYLLRHHGTRTRCNLDANGVLASQSRKTLRGTIDLVRGCKGSEGSEREAVLLVDEGVRNKTVPIILCNEDDVAGNHGATIGHIREEQLFYLASRGLSQEAAEAMFVGAMLEQAAIDAPGDAARAGVLRLGEQIVPGFTGLFDEE